MDFCAVLDIPKRIGNWWSLPGFQPCHAFQASTRWHRCSGEYLSRKITYNTNSICCDEASQTCGTTKDDDDDDDDDGGGWCLVAVVVVILMFLIALKLWELMKS